MNPFLVVGVLAVVVGLLIEQVQKKKQADDEPPDDSPDKIIEVSPDAKEIHNDSPDRLDDSVDSGDISASAVPKNSRDSSINLDS